MQESNENESRSSIVEQQEQPIEIISDEVWGLAFLADGEHIVSGGKDGRIQRWRVKDGKEVGSVDAGDWVCNIAVSEDGKWIVSGTTKVTVWDAETLEKVREIEGHRDWVYVVDISPDATKIASGSNDKTFCVWSLSTGKRLLGPINHDHWVTAVKFSPDGHLIATGTKERKSVQIYDSRDGSLLVDFPIGVPSLINQSLAWKNDSKELFALSIDGKIYCLDVLSKTTLSRWRIHGNKSPVCISLASNGSFIAASDQSSVSLWDTTTHKKIGSVIRHPERVGCMALSANYLVTGRVSKIILHNLLDILPFPYCDKILEIRHRRSEDHLEAIKSFPAQDDSERSTNFEKTVQQVADSQCTAKQKENSPNDVIQHSTNLEKTVQELRIQLADSQSRAKRKEDSLNDDIRSLQAQSDVVAKKLRTELADYQHRADNLLCAYRQKHRCESLYASGHVIDAAHILLEIMGTATDAVKADTLIMHWLSAFRNNCIRELERIGDKASQNEDNPLAAYSAALSLGPSTPRELLIKWARTMLRRGSTNDALNVATEFQVPRFLTFHAICDVLEGEGYVMRAIDCFRRMQTELAANGNIEEQAQWELGFQLRCMEKLEELVDVAMGSQNYNKVIEYLSTLLSFNTVDHADILIKRSKVQIMMNSWEDALKDADEVIKLDPSSHRGYEQRHAALHQARCYSEAVDAFDTMLSKLDPELRGQYIDVRPEIRRIIDATVSRMPLVLIDTTNGRLYNRSQLPDTFEALPLLAELVSSMTTELDDARVRREVNKFYEYAMLSHKWQYDEPLFQDVEHISVYELQPSLANIKLQTFCSTARSYGIRWAWSDTCCVDKRDKVVLEESLVAMFNWYQGSALTLVHLLGVLSQSNEIGLKDSIWNKRAWTYQEYLAANKVIFYTEDWELYLGLTLSNHKDSPIILSEMEQATGQSPILHPGLDKVREKLFLASTRKSTRTEDIAYSLFGIFNVAIPVIYGEGNRAVGRLLEHILTGSGDVTIVAWTGSPNGYNSCLPSDLTVYDQLVPHHLPPSMETAEVDQIVAKLESSIPDLSLVLKLYDRLYALPLPSLVSSRLRLAGIVFHVDDIVHVSGPDLKTRIYVYQATTTLFGDIEIRTMDDLTTMKALYLVHPWIHPLLDCDHEFSRAPPKATRALRLFTRLMQPFGALLFEQVSRVEYKRVAADSLIMVQICKDVSLNNLIDNVCTIDVQ